jgi:hypothetical protein
MGDEHNSGALSIGFKSLVHFDGLEFPNNKFEPCVNQYSKCEFHLQFKSTTETTDSISTIAAAKFACSPFNFHTTYL